MRLSRLELLFCTVFLAACGRPTLDPEEQDEDAGAVVERDAGAVTAEQDAEVAPPPRDAGDGTTGLPARPDASPPSPATDAGTSCPDRDMDGVCDAADNCPSDANPQQDDIDKDGLGDACSLAAGECDADMLGTALGSSTVSSVVIDGKQQTLASVKPGASVDITVTIRVDNCGTFGLPSISLGIQGEGDECKTVGFCSSEISVTAPLPFTLTAPEKKGLHYVVAGLSSSSAACVGGGGPAAATRIAALCVTPSRYADLTCLTWRLPSRP